MRTRKTKSVAQLRSFIERQIGELAGTAEPVSCWLINQIETRYRTKEHPEVLTAWWAMLKALNSNHPDRDAA